MKLRWPDAVVLFVLGAVASLIGDHSHVATGTTEYLSDAVPLVWSSPIWFPLLVALATVSLAELRLHMPAPRTSVTARQGLAGVAAVVGIYVTTALVHTATAVPVNVLIYALAVITWCASVICCGAVCGASPPSSVPRSRPSLAAAGLARYADDSDALFGVAPWLPALYFAFGGRGGWQSVAEIASLDMSSGTSLKVDSAARLKPHSDSQHLFVRG